MMAKKKTKWNRTHMFKRRKSNKNGVGHPAYTYGKSGRHFKFLVFTHKPEIGKEDEYEKLKHNIDPIEDGKRDAYVKKNLQLIVMMLFVILIENIESIRMTYQQSKNTRNKTRNKKGNGAYTRVVNTSLVRAGLPFPNSIIPDSSSKVNPLSQNFQRSPMGERKPFEDAFKWNMETT